MKNIVTKSLTVFSAVLLAAGCIEEAVPQGSVQTSDQVSDAGVAAAINAIPNMLVDGGTAGHLSRYSDQLDFGMASIHMRTDHMLDDIACMGDNPGYDWANGYASPNGWGALYTKCSYFWDCYYPWIKGANDVIGLVDPETALTENLNYLGQAYAYRAMFYLDLARMYEPKENNYTDISNVKGLTVPKVTEETTEADAILNPRVPREEMYEFIFEDLTKAETYLKGTSNNYTKPSLAAVYGLFARAYIEMGYWVEGGDKEAFRKASEYAKLAIETSGKTPLTQAQWEDPINGFNNGAANNSWIWGLPITTDNFNNLIAWVAHQVMEAPWGYGPLSHLGLNRATYEAITEGDFRKHSWLDPDWTGFGGSYECDYQFAGTAEEAKTFIAGAKSYEAIKFRPAEGNCSNYSVGNKAERVLMRVEEMYFLQMEAEAYINLENAKTLLNDFMKLRVTSGTYDCSRKASTVNDFLNEMMLQKRIEFWGEGILFYDYKRIGLGITRGYPGTNHAGSQRLNSEGRSPIWNIVIGRLEYQSNTAINENNCNPDPSGKLQLWVDE